MLYWIAYGIPTIILLIGLIYAVQLLEQTSY
jgi:hypothetical protein